MFLMFVSFVSLTVDFTIPTDLISRSKAVSLAVTTNLHLQAQGQLSKKKTE